MVDSKIAIYRLTALWAFVECGLGGILHAFKLPITGLVVGGIAITIISVIRSLSGPDFRGNILKALSVVIVIKATITPHAGITAYMAVAFQGLCAVIIYSIIPSFKVSTILHSMISMVESAIQKVLVLLILYGETLLRAIDQLGRWVGNILDVPVNQISYSIIGAYAVGFAIWGLMVGWIAIRLTSSIHSQLHNARYAVKIGRSTSTIMGASPRKKAGYFLIFTLMAALFIFSFFIEKSNEGWMLILRVIVILILFYKIIGPLLANLLSRFIKKYRSGNSGYINYVLDALPYSGSIARKAWAENKNWPFLKRINQFMIDVVMYQLYFIPEEHKL